jgi:peroxiredoxin
MQSAASGGGSSRWAILGAVVLLAAVAMFLGWQLGRSELPTTSKGNDRAGYPELLREFRLPSLDGRQLGPADFAGQAVLVEFWATWCGPCHVQAKILASLYRDLEGREVQFLAVSVGEDEETVRRFVEERPFAYPVLLDPRSGVLDAARIYALPTLLILDRRGEVVFLESGITPRRALESILERALDDRS